MKALSFNEFTVFIKQLEQLYENINSKEEYKNGIDLDDLFEEIDSVGAKTGTTMTSDISGVTPPITLLKKKKPKTMYETCPPDEKIQKWVIENKEIFKKQYGKQYEEILNRTAWEIYEKRVKM